MQGYTALLSEALRQLTKIPSHVFVQAGVGGIAAAVAGHLSVLLGENRPFFTIVDPSRARRGCEDRPRQWSEPRPAFSGRCRFYRRLAARNGQLLGDLLSLRCHYCGSLARKLRLPKGLAATPMTKSR